jgi:hypothetical protein
VEASCNVPAGGEDGPKQPKLWHSTVSVPVLAFCVNLWRETHLSTRPHNPCRTLNDGRRGARGGGSPPARAANVDVRRGCWCGTGDGVSTGGDGRAHGTECTRRHHSTSRHAKTAFVAALTTGWGWRVLLSRPRPDGRCVVPWPPTNNHHYAHLHIPLGLAKSWIVQATHNCPQSSCVGPWQCPLVPRSPPFASVAHTRTHARTHAPCRDVGGGTSTSC